MVLSLWESTYSAVSKDAFRCSYTCSGVRMLPEAVLIVGNDGGRWSTMSCRTVRFIHAPIPSQTPFPWPGAPNSQYTEKLRANCSSTSSRAAVATAGAAVVTLTAAAAASTVACAAAASASPAAACAAFATLSAAAAVLAAVTWSHDNEGSKKQEVQWGRYK